MDSVSKIFGGVAKTRVIRLFTINKDAVLDADTIAKRSGIKKDIAKKEANKLVTIGLLKKKNVKNRVTYSLNKTFKYSSALRAFFLATSTLSNAKINKQLGHCGTLKTIILSGTFSGADNVEADILIVGNNMDMKAVDRVIRGFESETGVEIAYMLISEKEFKYRLDIYDKSVRDIIDYPNIITLDRTGFLVK